MLIKNIISLRNTNVISKMRKNNLHHAIKAYGKGDRLFSVGFLGKVFSIVLLFLSISSYAQTVENKAVFIQGDAVIYSSDSDFNKQIDGNSVRKSAIKVEDSLGVKREAIVFRGGKDKAVHAEIERPARDSAKTFSEKLALKKTHKVREIQQKSTRINITFKPLSPKERFVAGIADYKVIFHQYQDYGFLPKNSFPLYLKSRNYRGEFSFVVPKFSQSSSYLFHGRAPPVV